jgi:hypothetical protein
MCVCVSSFCVCLSLSFFRLHCSTLSLSLPHRIDLKKLSQLTYPSPSCSAMALSVCLPAHHWTHASKECIDALYNQLAPTTFRETNRKEEALRKCRPGYAVVVVVFFGFFSFLLRRLFPSLQLYFASTPILHSYEVGPSWPHFFPRVYCKQPLPPL